MKTPILLISLLIALKCFTQTPEIVWQQCYGTSEADKNYGMVNTDHGYMTIMEVRTGENLTNYHGLDEIWIVSTDTVGEIIWEKCFGGTNHDTPRKIIKSADNNYYILCGTMSTDGDIQSFNHGDSDIWVIKINGQGGLLWEKCYGSPGTDEPRDMILTSDGGFITLSRISYTGGDISQYFGLYDTWMCKCDSLGNIEWEKTLGNDGLDNCVSMIINSEGNIMMIGAAQKHGGLVECYPDEVWGDVWLVELDLQGNIISQHCYGGSDYELGYDIKETPDGYIFIASSYSNDGDVTGHHGPSGGNDARSDFWVVNINNSGEIIWQKSLGGYDTDSPVYLTQTEEGFLAIGTTFSNNGDVSGNHSFLGTYADIWAVKLTPDGEIEWQQCYGGWGMERLENPHTILKKDDYNYVIASSTNYKSWNDDIQCDIHANYDYDAWIFEIDLDDTTGFYYTPAVQDQVRVYPNPAKEYVVFEFSVQGSVFWVGENNEILVTNTFGQQVALLQVKSEVTVWDTRNIKPGVYFYSLKSNESALTGKLIISK